MSDLRDFPLDVRPLLHRLFQPIRINRLELRNRSMMSSIHLNLEEFPDQFERMAHFYRLRARHGVGLIVTSGCAPDVAGAFAKDGFSLKSDAELPAHRLLTEAVHAEGGHIALQIMHFGREAVHGYLVSASPLKLASSIFSPRQMEEEEILTLIGAYADCAQRAIEAGYDAIELIYSQGFLIHQFLARGTNQREDRWGGSLENRMRLAIEVAKAVRERVGSDYPVIFRIPSMDLFEGGLDTEEALVLIDALLPYGIDLLSVSIGWHESYVPTIAMTAPRAAFATATRLVRERFPSLRLCASNRINDPRVAESLLLDGSSDMIAMARPFLADAAFMEKALHNDFDGINPCIACNQNCLDYVFAGQPVGCSTNPQAVRPEEGHYSPLAHAVDVAVVGGGIGGMAAALFLRRRGARVTLFESSQALGGQLLMAGEIPDKREFAGTVRYYGQALRREGVGVLLGRAFQLADALRFDHVVVATGCAPRLPQDLPGADLPHVRQYSDVLAQQLPVLPPVVIIGGGGVACDMAKYVKKRHDEREQDAWAYLSSRAKPGGLQAFAPPEASSAAPVTLVQRSSRKFAMRLGRTTRWIQVKDLQRLGVVMRNRLEIQEITAEGVRILDKKTQAVELLPARTVILAAGHQPRNQLVQALTEREVPHSVIGSTALEADERVVTNISSVIASAYEFAMAFGQTDIAYE